MQTERVTPVEVIDRYHAAFELEKRKNARLTRALQEIIELAEDSYDLDADDMSGTANMMESTARKALQ